MMPDLTPRLVKQPVLRRAPFEARCLHCSRCLSRSDSPLTVTRRQRHDAQEIKCQCGILNYVRVQS